MRVWGYFVLGLELLSTLGPHSGLAAEPACGVQTLQGSYSFSSRGWAKLDQRGYKPVAYIGMMSFDGKGNVLAKFRSDSDKATQTSKGNYTVTKTCDADVTLKNGRKATYFVHPTGNAFSFVVTSGLVASGDAQRVSSEMMVKPVKGEAVAAPKAKSAPQPKAQPKKS